MNSLVIHIFYTSSKKELTKNISLSYDLINGIMGNTLVSCHEFTLVALQVCFMIFLGILFLYLPGEGVEKLCAGRFELKQECDVQKEV